jgi:hypothetical protein
LKIINFGDFVKHFGLVIFGGITIKSVGDFKIKFGYSKINFKISIFGNATLKFWEEPINLVINKIILCFNDSVLGHGIENYLEWKRTMKSAPFSILKVIVLNYL